MTTNVTMIALKVPAGAAETISEIAKYWVIGTLIGLGLGIVLAVVIFLKVRHDVLESERRMDQFNNRRLP